MTFSLNMSSVGRPDEGQKGINGQFEFELVIGPEKEGRRWTQLNQNLLPVLSCPLMGRIEVGQSIGGLSYLGDDTPLNCNFCGAKFLTRILYQESD